MRTGRRRKYLAAIGPSRSIATMDGGATISGGRAERAGSARRTGPSRQQTVSNYLGRLAAEAAQAVRRAGLKPGLERSFGFAPEMLGRIVAQEPEVGSELARNGLVTLYVAAPGASPADEKDASWPRPCEQVCQTSVRGLANGELGSDHAGATAPRRKSRSSSCPERGFDAPPSPTPPVVDDATAANAPGRAHASTMVDSPRPDAPDHGESHGDEPADEYVDADALFAGPASADASAWRRVYPRRRRGVRARLAEHRRLAVVAVVLLGVWLVVAGATALSGQQASRLRPPAAARPQVRGSARERRRTAAATSPRPRTHRVPTPPRHVARRRQRPTPELKPSHQPPVLRVAALATQADDEPVAPAGERDAAAATREFGPAQREVKRLLHAPRASPTNTRR
jgi:hypothetical protein